jgi:hypothetical protein
MSRKLKQKTKQNTRVYVEIQGTWSMKCMITEATGIVTKVERKILKPNGFNGFPTKTAILGTSHIRGKVLQCETGSLSVRITICSREEVPERNSL